METVISELYRVFQPYRLGPDFSGCSHCVDPAETQRLAATDLRDLTLPDLDSYAFNAMTTWGEVCHFKHFLPRLLELGATDFREFLSFEVLLGKLEYGQWDDWPEVERRAVNTFLHEFWQSVIAAEITSPNDDSVDTALCAIGRACSSMTPFLQQWVGPDAPVVPCQLAQFVLLNIRDIVDRQRLGNAFWETRETQAGEVLEWIQRPTTYEYLYDRREGLDSRLEEAVTALAGL
jgi:hypothetical protein